ncbi:hypothetical protein JTE90_024057 [Oedothorax gibbosus]|uniref:Uncharacterized protein n=1 Tax=Oedothorax gibbosus TaxID=931172 RepID=A0AAV6TWN6_9ARAC|nr:hypothetical protein JTE90_024057 [Oedothorax gibbosus]
MVFVKKSSAAQVQLQKGTHVESKDKDTGASSKTSFYILAGAVVSLVVSVSVSGSEVSASLASTLEKRKEKAQLDWRSSEMARKQNF